MIKEGDKPIIDTLGKLVEDLLQFEEEPVLFTVESPEWLLLGLNSSCNSSLWTTFYWKRGHWIVLSLGRNLELSVPSHSVLCSSITSRLPGSLGDDDSWPTGCRRRPLSCIEGLLPQDTGPLAPDPLVWAVLPSRKAPMPIKRKEIICVERHW